MIAMKPVSLLFLIVHMCSISIAGSACANNAQTNRHHSPPCEDDVDSPPSTAPPSAMPSSSFEPTGVPTGTPSMTPSTSTAPSSAPTTTPSKSPSLSLAPTSEPSTRPSSAPTTMPSPLPSGSPMPSSAPTMMPSPLPSGSSTPSTAPSGRPSSLPSDQPTKSPTISPSPTTSPSSTPSLLPSENACVTNAGVFGDLSGATTAVRFSYELEVAAGADIANTVLPPLEQGIVDAVLSEVFGCGTGRRSLYHTRKLSVAGISRYPPDQISNSLACQETQTTSSNECVVVFGELTLYEDEGGSQSQETAEAVVEKIETDMNAGAFDDAQRDIVKVTFVELSGVDNSGTTRIQEGGEDPQVAPQNSSVRLSLFVTAGLLMAVIVGLAYRQRNKRVTEEATELGTQPLETAEEASETPVEDV